MESILIYNVQAGPIWDWRVVVDLFCGGIGVGAALLAIVLSGSRDIYRLKLGQTAAFLAPVMVMVGLLFLFTKLGNKFNVHQMAINVAPTSIMWWGFLIQSALILLGLCYAWQWRNIHAASGRRILGLVVGILALLVGAYHGLLLGALTSRPLWANGSMLFLSLAAFLSTGIAGAVLVHHLRMTVLGETNTEGHPAGMRPVYIALAVSLTVMLIALVNSWLGLRFGSLASREALAAATATFGDLLIMVGVGIGLILPFLMVIPVLIPSKNGRGQSSAVLVLACVLVLAGGFVTRYVVVLGGQLPPPVATLS